MRRFTPLLSLFFVFSCNQAPVEEALNCPTDERGVVYLPTIPEIDFDYDVAFREFEAADEDKATAALESIKKVVATEEFKKRVLGHTYKAEQTFVQNEGHSNEQIYQKILEAAETLNPKVDGTMYVDLTLYYSSSSTVGYTYPDTPRTWINSKFFDKYNNAEVARNIFHEWIHKIGFGHDSSSTARRPYSVPYGVGSIMEELAGCLALEGQLPPTTSEGEGQ